MLIFMKKGMTKEQTEVCRKKVVFKTKELCYSVDETHRASWRKPTRTASAWANRGNSLGNESFGLGWRHISKEDLTANMYGSREVGFVDILVAALLNDYMRGNQFREIVHNEPGEDFLKNVLHLFCVEM